MNEAVCTQNLLDLEHSLAGDWLQTFVYPWEALSGIGAWLEAWIQDPEAPSRCAYTEREPGIWVAESATIAKTATLIAPCVIGPNTEVRPGAFIRGNVLVGAHCVVGNSTELKNVILFDGVQVPHYNYVGDSILGYRAHMGAGSITSNVKADKSLIVLRVGETVIETQRKKFGAILGDYSEIGCNAVLNPGTVTGRRAQIYPLTAVRGFIPENHICKATGVVVERRQD